MSLESCFLNLVRGTRVSNLMGLKMTDGSEYQFGSDYTFLEIPLMAFMKDGEETEKVARNQHVQVIPSCSVEVKGRDKIYVEPNPALWEYGTVQGSYFIHPGSGLQIPSFYFQARRDVDSSAVPYAVRLYMIP